jgi:hypothetical protein
MPFLASPASNLPTYYTNNSGYLLNQPGHSSYTIELKELSNIALSTVIKTYTEMSPAGWTFVHDKDLDSNVWYTMPESTRVLYKVAFAKGATTITQTSLYTYSGATTSVLGACYAPAVMWSGTGYGAFIIGGFSQGVVHVLEFNSTKTGIANTYTLTYTSEVYGTEIIPKQASGFSQHYGVAYTRGSRQMSSWTVDMDTRSWTNRTDNSYIAGTNGPSSGDGMIYYPIGKKITDIDPDTSTNRIAMNDTSTAKLYVWTVTEGTNRLNWTYLKTVTIAQNGGYPYHMSTAAYNSIS